MRWFHVLAKVCRFLGLHKTIMDRECQNPYMERHYVFSTRFLEKWFPALSYRVVLHHVKKSDEDGLHDHPWPWWTHILSGGYWEDTPEGRFWRSARDGWRHGTHTDYHRLSLDPVQANGEETWSMFIMGPHKHTWGFQDRDGNKVHWLEYLRNREKYV